MTRLPEISRKRSHKPVRDPTGNGPRNHAHNHAHNRTLTGCGPPGAGFTLIELLVVLAIIASLLTLAVPRYFKSLDNASETVLAENLRATRAVIDQYYGDTGQYPDSLDQLVDKQYLRALPLDPITESTQTWILIAPQASAKGKVYKLRSYALATPRGQPNAPPSLQDLLKDPRLPGAVRHLRKLPFDPLTGSSVWGLLRDGDGDSAGILAVYSLAGGKPIKIGLFDARFADFEGKLSYSDWKFARPVEVVSNPLGLAKGLISPSDLSGGGGGGGGTGSGAPQPPGVDNGPGINAKLVSPAGPR